MRLNFIYIGDLIVNLMWIAVLYNYLTWIVYLIYQRSNSQSKHWPDKVYSEFAFFHRSTLPALSLFDP